MRAAEPKLAAAARDDAGEGGERRQLTVLFCDLVDSTALAARMDIEDWRQVLRAYEDAVSPVIARHGGRVAQRPRGGRSRERPDADRGGAGARVAAPRSLLRGRAALPHRTAAVPVPGRRRPRVTR